MNLQTTPYRVALILALACLCGTAEARHHRHSATQAGVDTPTDTAELSKPAIAPPAATAPPAREDLAAPSSAKFDYYLLSLSWSPNYCLLHPQDREQCSGKGYGFVLHGLWPQNLRGGYPQDCATSYKLDRAAIAYAAGIYPSAKLINHEWSKHGSCSGLNALDYFKHSDAALASIKVPQSMQAPVQPLQLTAKQITTAFTLANPGLTSQSLTLSCSGPELAEVRVCLSKTLKPAACGPDVRSSCRSGTIRIRSVR